MTLGFEKEGKLSCFYSKANRKKGRRGEQVREPESVWNGRLSAAFISAVSVLPRLAWRHLERKKSREGRQGAGKSEFGRLHLMRAILSSYCGRQKGKGVLKDMKGLNSLL